MKLARKLSCSLLLTLIACGSNAPPTISAEAVVAPVGPDYVRYAPPASVGYVYADLERFRQSAHAAPFEQAVLSVARAGMDGGGDNPVFAMLSDLQRGLIALEGGTASEPLAAGPLIVSRGVPSAQLSALLFNGTDTSSATVGGRPAQVAGGAALIEIGTQEYVFGVQEQQEAIVPNPAHRAPAFLAERFIAVQREQSQPSVFEAVVTLAGAEIMAGSPFGPLHGVVGASLDLTDEARAVITGDLDSEASAAGVVQELESLRQQLQSHPFALVFGAQAMLERIEIRQDGSRFRVVATATNEELTRLITQLGGFMELGQQQGEPAPAAPPSNGPVQTL